MQPARTPEKEIYPPPIMDIEASGFGMGSYPIEVGLAMPDDRSWCSLVRPEPDWLHWSTDAAATHHISRDLLLSHGRSSLEVVTALNEWLHGQVVYSDAWAHDYTWMHRLFEAAGRVPSFKLDNLRALLSEDEAAHWHDAKAHVASTMNFKRHRASYDALLLQTTLLYVKQRSIANV